MIAEHNKPLQVVGFLATRSGDPERGPLIRMNSEEARVRLLSDREVVRIYGPRRYELAELRIDETIPRGGVVLRDIAGTAPSELVRVVKVDLDSDRGKPRAPVARG